MGDAFACARGSGRPGPPSRRTPARFSLHLGGLSVEVDCDDPRLSRRLSETLSLVYPIDPSPAAADAIRVWVSSRSDGWPRCAGAGLRALAPVSATYPLLNHRGQELGRIARTSADGLLVARDLESGTWYLTDPRARAAHLIAGEPRRFAAEVRRYINGLVTAQLAAGGALLLHAAAVRLGSRAVLAVGERGSGKTTLALTLLHAFGAQHAANDTLMLRPGSSGVDLFARYGRMQLRPSSLEVFPALRRFARARRRPAARRADQEEAKLTLDGPIIRQLFGTGYLHDVGRAVVLFPRFEPGARARVERLSPTAGARRLNASVLPTIDRRAPWHDFNVQPPGAAGAGAPGAASLAGNPSYSWYAVTIGEAPLADLAPRLAAEIPELD